MDPLLPGAWYALAQCYWKKGDRSSAKKTLMDAMDALQKSQSSSPCRDVTHVDILCDLSVLIRQMGDADVESHSNLVITTSRSSQNGNIETNSTMMNDSSNSRNVSSIQTSHSAPPLKGVSVLKSIDVARDAIKVDMSSSKAWYVCCFGFALVPCRFLCVKRSVISCGMSFEHLESRMDMGKGRACALSVNTNLPLNVCCLMVNMDLYDSKANVRNVVSMPIHYHGWFGYVLGHSSASAQSVRSR